MTIQHKRILVLVLVVTGILLIPLIAMQFTDEVNWGVADFVIMGTVLMGAGLAFEFIARRSEKSNYRIGFAVGLLGAFLLFWVNAAVGIIGNEGQSANLLYGLVFLVGLAGALISRFKAKGMATTLFAAAATQMSIPLIALMIWPPPETSWSPSIAGVFVLSGFFAVLFLVSGLLFRNAGLMQQNDQVN